MKYFEKAKEIWQQQVPQRGQSQYVEGELIRVIEKLRWESFENGNANWDKDFKYFCQYIWEVLNDDSVFDQKDLQKIEEGLNIINNCKNPYLEDDIYDQLTDYVIEWHLAKDGPIPREKNKDLKR